MIRKIIAIIWFRYARYLLVLATSILFSCTKWQYVPEPINMEGNFRQIISANHHDEGFKTFLRRQDYPIFEWPIKHWDLHNLTLASVYFNPVIITAKSELIIQQANQIRAEQQLNPTLNIPVEYHSNSSDSPWFIGIVTDFLFERSDKRKARLNEAITKVDATKINIEQQVWFLYSNIHQSLIEYFAARKQKELLSRQKKWLQENFALLKRRQELGQISPFELSTIRFELQHIQLRISDQDYVINDIFHQLVSHTGLQVERFEQQDFVFSDLEQRNLLKEFDDKKLKAETLNSRFDIRIKLKEYEACELALKRVILEQYPDLNLSPGFIFDQEEHVWTLGAAWILPLFHNNEGEIQQALAMRANLQSKFLQSQTTLLNELKRKNKNYMDKLASYKNTLILLKELEQAAKQVRKQFDFGYSDRLSVIRAELDVEKANEAMFALRVDLLKANRQIESLLQKPLNNIINIAQITENLLDNGSF